MTDELTPVAGEVIEAAPVSSHEWALARQHHEKILVLMARIEASYLELGSRLALVRDHRLYRALSYRTFQEYLSAPEFNQGRATVYKAIQVVEAFRLFSSAAPVDGPVLALSGPLVAVERLAGIGIAKAARIAPLVRADPDQAEDWVSRAETQTLADLDLSIREAKEPALSQLHAAAHELGAQLAAMAHHLKGTHGDPLPLLEQLIAHALSGKEYLTKIQRNGAAPLCRVCHTLLPDYQFTICQQCFEGAKAVEAQAGYP